VRRGEVLELAERAVTIERLELLGWDPAGGLLEIEVRCSAGTYIRSLARDLGELLGCGGCLARLRRTEALGFDLARSISLARLEAEQPPPLDPLEALASWPRRQLSEAELPGWRCGRALPPGGPDPAGEGAVVIVDPAGRLAGMAQRRDDGWLQPRLVLDAAG
jgi:tRNA pseudouridine55 synthase